MGFNKFEKRGAMPGGGQGFGGGKPFGGKKFGGGGRPMFQATCSQCGSDCEVPFKPTGERPVYCHNCFKNQAGPSARFAGKPSFDRPPRPSFGDKPSFGGVQGINAGGGVPKAQFEALNQKLDRIISLLSASQEAVSNKMNTPLVIKNVIKEVAKEKKTVKKVAKKIKSKKK